MIEWIRYPENQPRSHEYFLVTNGDWFKLADHAVRQKRGFNKGYKWVAENGEWLEDVTHYAELHYPVEGANTMTSTEPMTYKPGKSLDNALARQFGWEVDVLSNGFGIYVNQEEHKWEEIPMFSTTWEGMRLVVEEMQRRGYEFTLRYYEGMIGYWWGVKFGGAHFVTEKAAPHAVCMAALSALQHVSHTDGLGDRDD